MPSFVDLEYVAQHKDNEKLFEKLENDEIVLTDNINKAAKFDLLTGAKFIEQYKGEFMLKTVSRIRREKEHDKRTNR